MPEINGIFLNDLDFQLITMWAEDLKSEPSEFFQNLMKEGWCNRSSAMSGEIEVEIEQGSFASMVCNLSLGAAPSRWPDGLGIREMAFCRRKGGSGGPDIVAPILLSLEELYISRCKEIRLSLQGVPNLKTLSVFSSEIEQIDLRYVPKLELIYCHESVELLNKPDQTEIIS
jgi:hypothetical protein